MTYTPADPMVRLKAIRDYMATEGAKMPKVDHNGRIIEPEPVEIDGAPPPSWWPRFRPDRETRRPTCRQGGGSAPHQGHVPDEAVQRANPSGDVMSQMALANRPRLEAGRLGISVQEWHRRYADLPA